MRLIGLDPSLTSPGIATPGGVTVLPTLPSDRDDEDRLVVITQGVLAAAKGADLVIMEGLAFGAKGSAVTVLAGLHWAIRMTLRQAGIPYLVVPGSVPKKYVTGKGNANKDAVVAAVASRLGDQFEQMFDPNRKGLNDRVDAWALRQCAVAHYTPDDVDVVMPSSHRSHLAHVAWPDLRA
jgi:crossover junction endodeoxyribonuclease RuvC